MNKARKLTFPNVGTIQGSRVWRNSETGVEIVKGKNFAEVGLYYVCAPKVGPDVRRVVSAFRTLSEARKGATGLAEAMRDLIGRDHLDAIDIEARASMNPAFA